LLHTRSIIAYLITTRFFYSFAQGPMLWRSSVPT